MTQLFTVQTEDLIKELESRSKNSVIAYSKIDESNELVVITHINGDSKLEQYGLLEFVREEMTNDWISQEDE